MMLDPFGHRHVIQEGFWKSEPLLIDTKSPEEVSTVFFIHGRQWKSAIDRLTFRLNRIQN